jgi:hypothetical protein
MEAIKKIISRDRNLGIRAGTGLLSHRQPVGFSLFQHSADRADNVHSERVARCEHIISRGNVLLLFS